MTDHLSPVDLLRVWDTAADRGPVDRALALLWAAGADADTLPTMSLTERDRRLLHLRAATFGDHMACVMGCPECDAAVEVVVSAATLATGLPVQAPERLHVGDAAFVLRPLDSRDLAAAAAAPDLEAAAAVLRDRAITEGTASAEMLDALTRLVDARVDAGEIRLVLDCPACAGTWTEVLDVGRYVWTEVEAAALRLVTEVAEIARAFHWTEADILALSPLRRQVYLDLARTP